MTTPTTALHTRIDALLSTVALNPGMVATAQQERDRGILEVLREMEQRLTALEAWKREQEGDGR